MSVKGLPVNRLIDDIGNNTNYGITELDKYVVIVDLKTKYMNASKLASQFNTRGGKPKQFSDWVRRNQGRIRGITADVTERTPTELVNGKIIYDVNEVDHVVNEAAISPLICITTEKMTLADYNNRYTKNTNCLHNLIIGTYVHMNLCVRLLEWLDPRNYCIHAAIVFGAYKKAAAIDAVANNELAPEQVVEASDAVVNYLNAVERIIFDD